MIFKSEEPNIKNFLTEPPQNEVNPETPFEYRRDVSAAVKRKMLEHQEKLPPWHDFEHAAKLKYLGFEIPKPNAEQLHTLIKTLEEAANGWGDKLPEIRTSERILAMALYDRKIFDQISADSYRRLEKKIEKILKSGVHYISWTDLALIHLIKPDLKLDNLGLQIESSDSKINSIKHAALARIAGLESPYALDGSYWAELRQRMSTNLEHQAFVTPALAFYSRVINAKEVTVDEDGLHIIDYALPESPKPASQNPRPSPKHL